jgi:hypothetical protein
VADFVEPASTSTSTSAVILDDIDGDDLADLFVGLVEGDQYLVTSYSAQSIASSGVPVLLSQYQVSTQGVYAGNPVVV